MDSCAKCGRPRKEHSYNGACYGICGEFVPVTYPSQRWQAQISGQIRTITAAQDYSAELRDPEAEFWRKADGIC